MKKAMVTVVTVVLSLGFLILMLVSLAMAQPDA